MVALPMIKYRDVFNDILRRFFTGRIARMLRQLALEGPE